jgi:hypothetical protein
VPLLAAALSAPTTAVQAEVVYTNFGPGMSYDTTPKGCSASCYLCQVVSDRNMFLSYDGVWKEVWIETGDLFVPEVTTIFASAQLALLLSHPEVGLKVSLREAGANGLPGALLEEIWIPGARAGVFTATSVLRPRLTAGLTYWLTVTPPPLSSLENCVAGQSPACGSAVYWCANSTDDTNAPMRTAYHTGENPPNPPPGANILWYYNDWSTRILRGAFQINGDGAPSVDIDIKPGSFPNSTNPRSKGVIPVAILGSATFDVATVKPDTARFGRTGTEAPPAHYAFEHVNGDGYIDMILHFRTQQTGIACGSTQASLTAATITDQSIGGQDSIQTVGCK